MISTDTMQVTDVIVGGAGVDTLNYKTAGAVKLGSISGVEVMNASSLAGLTLDTSTITDLTNLNSSNVAGVTKLTAAATTNVTAAISEDNVAASTLANTISGGKDVTVNATKMGTAAGHADTIVVGTGLIAPTGDVVVNQTGAAYTAATLDSTLSTINVTGGKTISVTQKATSDSSAAATDILNTTITQGAVTIAANTTTTAVTVKQDATVAPKIAAATTGGVTETASVKFGALKTGDKLTIESTSDNAINPGEFTLTAVTDMSATEVAAAFANLINGSAYGSLILAGDTQSGAAFTKGTYAGLDTLWTSAAASGDTVVFTSNAANADFVGDIDFFLTNTSTNSVAPVVTTTQGKGHDATITGGVMGVKAGVVDITATATVKTVTVDGYDSTAAAATNKIQDATTNTALATINLSNGGGMTIDSAASTLALNLEKVSGAIAFTVAPATLNIKSTGDNTIGTLTAAATTALTVSGTGTLSAITGSNLGATKTIVVTETAGLNLGTTVLPAALESVNTTGTTGTVTLNIDGTKATYTGGAGVDNVTVNNASTAVAKAIDLGAGNDKLILAGGTVLVPTADLKGGAGTDTLSIDAASAATHGGGVLFAGKVTGFEKLELTAATTNNVNVEKLGNYNYVISNSTSGTVAALTITDLANNGTLEIANGGGTNTSHVVAIKDAATGAADNLNIVVNNTGAASSTLAAGNVTAANVETIKVTTTDATPTIVATGAADINTNSMALTADKATALTIDGNAGLNLTLHANTTKLVTIDASKMTEGGLTVTANGANAMTITGGAGADVLTASTGATAKADILVGGAGNDTLYAGSNGAKLTGGAGNDLFVLNASTSSTAVKGGTGEATTHSYITDFKAGDLLQLSYNTSIFGTSTGADAVVTSFTKLAANQSANAVYSDYVNAAMAQMVTTTAGTAGDAVWFSFAGNSYVIVDSGVETIGTFTKGEDLAIELTGVANLNGASFNSDFGTIAL